MPATKPAANSSAHVRTVVLDRYRTIWLLKEHGSSGPIRSRVGGGPERQRCPPPAGLRRSLDALVGGNDPKGWSRHGLPESCGSHYLTITVKPVPASSSTWAHSPRPSPIRRARTLPRPWSMTEPVEGSERWTIRWWRQEPA